MDMSSNNSTMATMMKPWLHFTGGDVLFFRTLAPSSAGAVAAACIVLFVIALVDRGLSGFRAVMEARWRQGALAVIASNFDKLNNESSLDFHVQLPVQQLPSAAAAAPSSRRIPPFIFGNDVARGCMQASQSLLHYILMLAVMTFHAGYIIAILAGLGIGEAVFARMKFNNGHGDIMRGH